MIKTKSDSEIKILKEAGQRLADVMDELISTAKPGVHVEELNDLADRLIRKRGDIPAFFNYKPKGAKRPYPASICVSINEEIVHGIPTESDHVIKEGDLVSLDVGLVHRNLVVDTAYTVGVGDVDARGRRLLSTGKEALARGVAAARGGSHVGDIGAAIEQYVRGEGCAIFRRLVGHGTGYRVHEDPYVPNYGRKGEGEKLVPGLVIAIEPMIGEGKSDIELLDDGFTYRTKDGSRSVHFEHTIVITEDEPIVLTAIQE